MCKILEHLLDSYLKIWMPRCMLLFAYAIKSLSISLAGDLKKMFKKIADSKTEDERDKNYEPLQELITLVQFANDECDYGEGLELGMDLFCYGGSVFHSTIGQLMPLAYMLLNKPEFQKIIETHLKKRSRDSNLSQLD